MGGRKSQSDLRRMLLAIVLVFLSLAAHAAAAGSLPGVTAILGGAVVAGGLAWSLAGGRRSVTSLVVILFAGQLLIHAVVVALGHHGVNYLPDAQMSIAHLLAAGVAAMLFARGEQIVAGWVRAAGRLLGAPRLFVPGVASRPTSIPSQTVLQFSSTSLDVHACSRRGPPNLLGALTFA